MYNAFTIIKNDMHYSTILFQSHTIQSLETYTQYLVSVQVFNPEGHGPPTQVIVTTDEGGEFCLEVTCTEF